MSNSTTTKDKPKSRGSPFPVRSVDGRLSPDPGSLSRSGSPSIMSQEEVSSKASSLVRNLDSSVPSKPRRDSRSSEEDFVILENEDMNDNIKTEEEPSIKEHVSKAKTIEYNEKRSEMKGLVASVPCSVPARLASVSKSVQLDVVELLKQVLQWTPLYKPGLNKALIQAAKVGSMGCVKVLLSAGAEVDTEDENGDTPFVHAFRGCHANVMEVLRDMGCNTEIIKMSLALATKDKEFVKLCHQMEIPVENEDWNTGDPEEVRILLEELKLDPFQGLYGRHGYEDSPFMYLTQEGRPEILEMLVALHPCLDKYSQQDKQDKVDRALYKAIKHHRLDNVKLLLASCAARLDVTDAQNRTPFLFACGHDQAIASYLLDLGVDHSGSDHEGLNALHWAACAGYKGLCDRLLEKGMDVGGIAKLGATPLMVACSNGHVDIAASFLKAGADPNVRTPEGWTALHVAVRACVPGIVKLLLAHDAQPDVQSSKLTHNSDVVPASTPLLIAIALNSMKIIKHLLHANCDINLPGLVFTSPSHSSSESDEDYKYQKQKCTPIQYAIISRAWDITELLIKVGCNVQPVRLWLEYKRAPVHIPEEKSKYLRHLIYLATTSPPKLRYLVRRKVRQLLGGQLVTKVGQLHLPLTTQQFLLYQDLFRAQAGSFEV